MDLTTEASPQLYKEMPSSHRLEILYPFDVTEVDEQNLWMLTDALCHFAHNYEAEADLQDLQVHIEEAEGGQACIRVVVMLRAVFAQAELAVFSVSEIVGKVIEIPFTKPRYHIKDVGVLK